LRKTWKSKQQDNKNAFEKAPTVVQQNCMIQWTNLEDQHLCARIIVAGQPLAQITADIYNDPVVRYEVSDPSVVKVTEQSHPHGQCRLDTARAGALCLGQFSDTVIPGFNMSEKNGLPAQQAAFQQSCSVKAGDKYGPRPACWFKEN